MTLPAELHDAYNWTAAAGELDELRALTGSDLRTYCADSAINCASEGDGSVSSADLRALHAWLVRQP